MIISKGLFDCKSRLSGILRESSFPIESNNSSYFTLARALRAYKFQLNLIRNPSPENYKPSLTTPSFTGLIPGSNCAVALATAMAITTAVDFSLPTAMLSNDNQIKLSKDSIASDLIFGSISGLIGKVVEHPFDTIKVRMQVQTLGKSQGAIATINQSIQQDGLKGLYRGLSAPLLGSMVENSVLFLTYNNIQNIIKTGQDNNTPLSISQLSLAGFISGACVSFVMTPVELIKCRLQSQNIISNLNNQKNFKGPCSILYHTLKNHGISGIYRGHLGTLLRESFGGAAWFGTYELSISEFIKRSSNSKTKDDLPTWKLMAAGALSGVSYNASLFPADVVKSRQQVSEDKQSFLKISKDIYRAEGIRGFYRGFAITIMRSAPTSAVIFASYEWLSKNLTVEL